MAEAFLEVKPSTGRAFSFTLGPKAVRIGRDPQQADLVLDDPLLSKLHLRLEAKGQDFVLIDEGSRNGTFIGGKRADQKKEIKLKDGDEITLGLTGLKFRAGTAGKEAPPVRRFLGSTQEYFKINDLLDGGQSQDAPIPEHIMRLLVRLAEEVLPEIHADRVYHAVVSIACETLNGGRAAILRRKRDGVLEILARFPEDAADIELPESFYKAVAERRGVVLVRDSMTGLAGENIRQNGERLSLLGIPIWQQHEVSALLYVESQPSGAPFTTTDAAQGSIIAALIGPAVFQSQHADKLEQEKNRLLAQIRAYQRSGQTDSGYLLGSARALIKLREQVLAAADLDTPIFVTGEVGSGKEATARAIHAAGPRAEKPFVSALCGGLEPEALGRELFGEGLSSRPGLVQLAWGGTLFLDEISELPVVLQDRLVKMYSEPTSTPRPHLMASSIFGLPQLLEQKKINEPFLRLINAVTVTVPPLRERQEDIPILAQHFLKQHTANSGKSAQLTPDALSALEQMTFQSNLRDLSNIIERALVLVGSSGMIDPRHLSRTVVEDTPKAGGLRLLKEAVNDFERGYVMKVLAEQLGHRTRTAKVLGLSRQALSEKLRRYGIRDREDDAAETEES